MARTLPVGTAANLKWPLRIAGAMSLFPLLASLAFVFLPKLSAAMCGFPVPTSATHHSYVALLSAREAYIGLVALTLWWKGEVRALGWVLLLLSVVPAMDGWVALQHGATPTLQAMGHWGSIAAAVAIGYTLINA